MHIYRPPGNILSSLAGSYLVQARALSNTRHARVYCEGRQTISQPDFGNGERLIAQGAISIPLPKKARKKTFHIVFNHFF
jgi:hypothetical protein